MPEAIRVEVGDGLGTAASIHRPAELPQHPVVLFAFPGGGYSQHYFDIQYEGGSYSEASFHVRRGWIVVTCDHLGVGESDQPDPSELTFERLAAANDAAVRAVLDRLEVAPRLVIGAGQSMGGCLTIVAQARHATFDAIAVLGFSARQTVLPTPNGHAVVTPVARGSTDEEAIARTTEEIGAVDIFRWAFHSDDADPTLVDLDMAGGYPIRETAPVWGSISLPPAAASMLTEGVVAEEAAAVEVPVFVGCGARDTVPDPRGEPVAYARSNDITVRVVERMAHMHNFARTREQLWQRLHAWGEGLLRP